MQPEEKWIWTVSSKFKKKTAAETNVLQWFVYFVERYEPQEKWTNQHHQPKQTPRSDEEGER